MPILTFLAWVFPLAFCVAALVSSLACGFESFALGVVGGPAVAQFFSPMLLKLDLCAFAPLQTCALALSGSFRLLPGLFILGRGPVCACWTSLKSSYPLGLLFLFRPSMGLVRASCCDLSVPSALASPWFCWSWSRN